MSISSAPQILSTSQIAMLPTHDPLVGRIVGSIFEGQNFEGKPEKADLSGRIGSEGIALTYERQADGSVTADGYVGSVEVHERFGTQGQDGMGGSRLFGVAGSGQKSEAAVATGTTAGQAETVKFSTSRESQEVPMTDALRSSGTSSFSMGQKISTAPTFGGAYVDTNLLPFSFPTETVPIKTEDTTYAGGKIGDAEFGRSLKWNTTTWSVASSNREAWAYNAIYQAEDATESEAFVLADEKTVTKEPFVFHVKNGEVTTRGNLVTQRPGQPDQAMAVERSYKYIPGKTGVSIRERFGDTNLEFDIFPGTKK